MKFSPVVMMLLLAVPFGPACDGELSSEPRGSGTLDGAAGPPARDGSVTTPDGTVTPPPPPPSPAPDAAPPPPACAWPTTNLGVATGQHLPSSLSWEGFAPGEAAARRVSIDEFYDCDGSRGLDALLLITSQYDCSNCDREAAELTSRLAGWAAEGLNIAVVSLKIEDLRGATPATIEGARIWRDRHGLTTSYVVYDTRYSLVASSGTFGTPLQTIVNPRTMEVMDYVMGYDPRYTALLRVARSGD